MLICMIILVSFPSGKRPTMADLVALTKPDGARLHIMEIISSHSIETCVQFAEVLLNDPFAVHMFMKSSRGVVKEFIQTVLSKWIFSVDGPPVECTWPNLLDCMSKAGMNEFSIKTIREVVMPQ